MASGRAGLATALEIRDLVREDLAQVEREINLESVASADAVTAISQYLQSNGGKRLRPTLLLLTARMAGDPSPAAVRLAAVVEMIHAATLVHDDVIDYAETRRGKPSANAVWGNHICVLAGDWLYMQAFQIALRERNFAILDILISLTQRMVEGELIQLERIGRIGVSETDYMELVDRKTASLFAACTRLGALVAGASDTQEADLADFGWNLGMAFQLTDDILDFTADESVLGKPVGNDLREGKVTLPLIYALADASASERRLVETVLAERGYGSVAFAEVFDLIERRGGLARARERARAFTDKARGLIAGFPESPFQRALHTVADLITRRES